MSKYHWRNSPDIVAKLVNPDNIQTYLSRKVTLKPNEAAVYVVEGKIGNAITGKTVRDIGGGFARFLGDILKLTADDRRIIFAMTGPMDIWLPFRVQIKDGSIATGHLNLRLQIMEDNIAKLLNIFANKSPTLTRDDIAKIINTEVNARVLSPLFSSINDNSEIRTSGFQSKIDSLAESELRPILSVIGMKLLASFAVIDETDYERILQLRSDLRNATQVESENAKALAERITLREESMLRRIECEVNIAKAKARGKVDVDMETNLKELRVQEAYWKSELTNLREKNLIEERSRESKTENAIKLFEKVQNAKRLRQQTAFDNEKELIQIQNSFQENMMQLAAENDAVDSSVIIALLEQQTAQKAVVKIAEYSETNNSLSSCSDCGKEIESNWKLCPFCGNSL